MAPKKGVKRSASEADLQTQSRALKQSRLSFNGAHNAQDAPPTQGKKPVARRAAGKKAPSPEKLYKDTIAIIDKTFNQLHKKYKPNPNGWSGITADNFAGMMQTFLPAVRKLKEDSPMSAFNLVMDIGEHAYGDLEACMKSSGFGDTEEPFQRMDELAVSIIDELRTGAESEVSDQGHAFEIRPSGGDMGKEEKEILELLSPKRPNKQERKELDRARLADLKALFATRRERRLSTDDWAGNALNDLVETRDRIGQYGIGEHFFCNTIKSLASIKGIEPPRV
ncbi:hypothetical protein F4778DRAFT_713399, partial [Xylariomycetidae sp. FL2044]